VRKGDVPAALRVIAGIRAVEERIVTRMAYFCGGLFMLLALYTAFDVVGRRYFGVFSGVTDEMGGYALALGASWAFAYTLKVGGHVRVDVILPRLPRPLRGVLDGLTMAFMAVFAGTVSAYLWKLVLSSYAIQATGHSIIQTPQWIPQALMAAGYTTLAIVAGSSLVLQIVEALVAARRVSRHEALATDPVLPPPPSH
jgi:TRAP-type mannitol/chloroaromatic compound transport system permease small subunit